MSRTEFTLPSFSKETPDKIGNGISVPRRNTLIRTDNSSRCAIADEPIDAKIDGKKIFCVRVENFGMYSWLMIGFTPLETFDSNKIAYFGYENFTGCGINLDSGSLYPVTTSQRLIDNEISKKTKEIIVILEIWADLKLT
jgi:hypothetical protein